MPVSLLTLLLALQIALCTLIPSTAPRKDSPAPQQLFFGMLDPSLSAWFARVPFAQEEEERKETVLWDWSWRGFLASLFGQPLVKEADGDAVSA